MEVWEAFFLLSVCNREENGSGRDLRNRSQLMHKRVKRRD